MSQLWHLISDHMLSCTLASLLVQLLTWTSYQWEYPLNWCALERLPLQLVHIEGTTPWISAHRREYPAHWGTTGTLMDYPFNQYTPRDYPFNQYMFTGCKCRSWMFCHTHTCTHTHSNWTHSRTCSYYCWPNGNWPDNATGNSTTNDNWPWSNSRACDLFLSSQPLPNLSVKNKFVTWARNNFTE